MYIGLVCIKIIEFFFSDMPVGIRRYAVEIKLIQPDEIFHYAMYEEIDKKHAKEIYVDAKEHLYKRYGKDLQTV